MSNCKFSLLPTEALLHIVGPDTLTFLQGQTTCDTRALENSGSLPGVHCTPKGRVVCDFLLLPLATEHFALRMRRDILESSSTVLGKYIVFSKADIDVQRDDWQVAGLWGDDAKNTLQSVFGAVPQQVGQTVAGEGYAVVQRDEAATRFECFLHEPTAGAQITQLHGAADAGPASEWHAQEITAGIARIEKALVEALIPQSLNFDLTGHINFSKGCYTGQEVVARLHYRGTPKRRAFAISAPAEVTLQAGQDLFASTSNSAVGQVINCAESELGSVALVSATLDGSASGLHLASPDGPILHMLDLPYSIQPDED